MLLARSPPPHAGASGRYLAASHFTAAILTSPRMPPVQRDCRFARRARVGGPAKSLNRSRRLSPTSPTSTSALPPASAGAGLALLALSGAGAQASQHTTWGTRLSSPLVAMLLGGVAAAAFPSVLSSSSSSVLNSAVSGTLVPLAACLALLEIDDSARGEQEEKKAGNEKESRIDPTLAVFLSFALASLATVAATLGAVSLCFLRAPFFSSSLPLLPSEATLPRPLLIKVAACLCASYVGGSVNFAATATALGLSSTSEGARAMAAAFAADLVAMALYFGALAALRIPKEEDEWAKKGSGSGGGGGREQDSPSPSSSSSPSVSTLSAALSLAAASSSVALGELIAVSLGCPSAALAVAALVASAFGFLGRRTEKLSPPPPPFAGARAASSSLMLLFFASCGAQAGSPSSLRAAASLGGFVALLLALQLAATLVLGRGSKAFSLLPLPLPALAVGANAAIGGPGTAAAAASARSWQRLVRPAVLAGSAGYAIGTGVGVAVAGALSRGFG